MSEFQQPAFPTYEHNDCYLDISSTGMTLRDYFAAKAMQSLVHPSDSTKSILARNARLAYEQADEMMMARDAAGLKP